MSRDLFVCTLAHGWFKLDLWGACKEIVIAALFRQLTMIMEPPVAKRQRISELGVML
jgi:hypothetical protein